MGATITVAFETSILALLTARSRLLLIFLILCSLSALGHLDIPPEHSSLSHLSLGILYFQGNRGHPCAGGYIRVVKRSWIHGPNHPFPTKERVNCSYLWRTPLSTSSSVRIHPHKVRTQNMPTPGASLLTNRRRRRKSLCYDAMIRSWMSSIDITYMPFGHK
jgi:hypothetical protein